MGGIGKPKPIKVFGRNHYACRRCKMSKIKCSGETPCSSCRSVNKEDTCVYPVKDRKIVIMESELDDLYKQVETLRKQVAKGSISTNAYGGQVSDTQYQHKAQYDVTNDNSLHQLKNQNQYSPPQHVISNHVAHGYPDHLYFRDCFHESQIKFSTLMLKPSERSIHMPVQRRSYGLLSSTLDSSQASLDEYLFPDFVDDYLPASILDVLYRRLPDKSYAMQLISAVYDGYASEFYLLDINEMPKLLDEVYDTFASFNETKDSEKAHNVSKKINYKSLCYLFIIMAFGEQTCNFQPKYDDEDEHCYEIPGMRYYILASHLFHLTREDFDFQFIQSSLLLAIYSINLNRYNSAYNYIGVSIRSVFARGFHRQPQSPAPQDPVELEKYKEIIEKSKRLFWSIFVIEGIWSSNKMILPIHIDYLNTDVDLPCDDFYDLKDGFNSEILETNVHLAKYLSKFIRVIYGPNMRTFSVNYINTEQFNNKLMIKNTIKAANELIINFEQPYLSRYSGCSILFDKGRTLANLILRYNQLLLSISRPLLAILICRESHDLIENQATVNFTISKAVSASLSTIDILTELQRYNKLFILGFWDSQHLFNALIFLILVSLWGDYFAHIDKAVALLKYMAEKKNMNGQNCLRKLLYISHQLDSLADSSLKLNLDVEIESYPRLHTGSAYSGASPSTEHGRVEYYSTSSHAQDTGEENLKIHIESSPTHFDYKKRKPWNHQSQWHINSLVNTIQSWDQAKRT